MAKKKADLSIKSAPALIDDLPAGRDIHQQMMLVFTHVDAKNKVIGTLQNMRDLLNFHDIACRYNVISKRIFFDIPGESFSVENGDDAAFACIYSLMNECGLPVANYLNYLLRIADENQYNPVMSWINSKPWDGYSRLPNLYRTIESPEEEAKNLLIRRWLITAVAMAKGEGVDSAGCLVLQGGQDMGKTWWINKLVPEDLRDDLILTAASVDPHNKDSVSKVISHWIVELGEIDATFNRADLQSLKAFITSNSDIMRRPYGVGDRRYPRRTALAASVDQTIFLHDTAGNRRFWTIPCKSINSYHDIDMQQLWAEVAAIKEDWRLTPDEKSHIARINGRHMQIDPIEEKIRDKYMWGLTEVGEWKTATEVAEEIGIKNFPTQKETRTIAAVIRKLNNNKESCEKKSSGLKFWIPAKA